MWKKFKQKSSIEKKRKIQAGQALIEFVLGLMIVISFFAFFMKMSAVFVVGNFIHYATFMSARAYMSSDLNQGVQQANGETVLREMVQGRWSFLIKPDTSSTGNVPGGYVGSGPYAQESMQLDAWNQGTTYTYSANLSLLPWSKENQSVNLKLSSESWMPREQSSSECKASMANAVNSLSGAGVNISVSDLELDNGC